MTSSLVLLFTNFLNHKTDSILAVAAAMAIGASFKDLITSIVNNFLQPLIIKLILLTNISRLTKFANMHFLFSAKNNILNFSNVVVSILSFIFIVVTVYIMVSLINSLGSGSSNNSDNDNNKNNDVKDKTSL
jgi:large-conductance mechanosensitive channel